MSDHAFQILGDIYAERVRQEAAEGYTPEHDDKLDAGELPLEALGYVESLRSGMTHEGARRHGVQACVLLMREIERLDRATGWRSPLDRTESTRFRRVRS